ncbi:MAG: protein kinase domain-containing protein [Pyrinomonadaceae bacterium]
MDLAKWQIIKETFSKVIDLPFEKRSVYLSEIEDQQIRQEITNLLNAHGAAEGFIDKPIFVEREIVEVETEDNLIGKQVKDYLILKQIGTGGMGTVYLAERLNSDFKQKVALKIIKRGMDSEAILKRFATERKILASLKHPNIAELLDGGISQEGLPFFVMEYVEGQTLTEFCQAKNPSVEDRLKLFQQICGAVEFAHRNLIIHRDLKPSNIIVSKGGVPKLLDFGVSKLLSDSEAEATQMENRVFTPEYASPEQILEQNVTTATDIYSLGIILYEILSGHRPYQTKGKTLEEIIAIVCESKITKPSEAITDFKSSQTREANSPSQFSKGISGDLDNITLKSIRKEPAERYGSAQQFSEDIDRCLNGFPVIARPQTRGYRFGKYIKRHKAGVLAAALVLVSLVGGISFATWQAFVARRERARAEENFNDVRNMSKKIIFDFDNAIKDIPGSIAARKLLVTISLEYLDKLAVENQQDSKLQMELAEGYEQIANIQGGYVPNHLGNREAALKSFQRALVIKLHLVKIEPSNVEFQKQLGITYFNIGKLYYAQANITESKKMAQNGIDIFERLLQQNPQHSDIQSVTATGYSLLQAVEAQSGNLEEWGKDVERALKLAEEASKNAPTKNNLMVLTNSLNNYGSYLLSNNKTSNKAVKAFQRAINILNNLSNANPNNITYQQSRAEMYLNIAYFYFYNEDYEAALRNCQKAAEISENAKNRDPKNEEIKRFASQTERWNSKILIKLGKGIEVIPNLNKSLESLETQYKASPSDKLVYFEIGEVKLQLGYAYKTLAEKSKRASDKRTSCNYFQTTYNMYEEFLAAGFTDDGAFNEKELNDLKREARNCGKKLN